MGIYCMMVNFMLHLGTQTEESKTSDPLLVILVSFRPITDPLYPSLGFYTFVKTSLRLTNTNPREQGQILFYIQYVFHRYDTVDSDSYITNNLCFLSQCCRKK